MTGVTGIADDLSFRLQLKLYMNVKPTQSKCPSAMSLSATQNFIHEIHT